jgi:hypothetical protein
MIIRVLAYSALGIAFATGALALPVNRLPAVDSVVQSRMTCNENGRCWREVNPMDAMARRLGREYEGRSIYRRHDWDRGHDWDHRGHDWDRRGRDWDRLPDREGQRRDMR